MITVNMHEAKSRLSELVKAVEESGEIILICRQGEPVAQLRGVEETKVDRLTPDATLKPIAINYDPTEPLTEDEWPSESR
jgi:prevent-host-death family protein